MKPDFALSAGSHDITQKIKDRLLSLTVKDDAGLKSDSLSISLDDRGHVIALPRVGETLALALGYEDDLVHMGEYVVDNVALSAPPATMVISAKAVDFIAKGRVRGLQTQRTESWKTQSFGSMVKSIAERNGYKAEVAQVLKDIELPFAYQTEESDLNFLLRQSRELGVIVKVMRKRICCTKEKSGEKNNGGKMPSVKVTPDKVTSWNVSISHREKFNTVETKYYNRNKAKMETCQEGKEDPVYQHTQTYANKNSARAAAKALLKRFSYGSSSLKLSMPGNVEISAERILDLDDFRTGVDGKWICDSATHTFSSSGFSTSVKASIAT